MSESIIHISNGEIVNKITVRNAFKDLADGRYSLKIEAANKRSLNQNAYYWGVVLPLVKDGLRDIGYREIKTIDDTHEALKYMFLKKQIGNENTGEVIEILGSTAKLTTVNFNEYIEDIAKWCAEFLGFCFTHASRSITNIFKLWKTGKI